MSKVNHLCKRAPTYSVLNHSLEVIYFLFYWFCLALYGRLISFFPPCFSFPHTHTTQPADKKIKVAAGVSDRLMHSNQTPPAHLSSVVDVWLCSIADVLVIGQRFLIGKVPATMYTVYTIRAAAAVCRHLRPQTRWWKHVDCCVDHRKSLPTFYHAPVWIIIPEYS